MLDSTMPETDFWARLASALPCIRSQAAARDQGAQYPDDELRSLVAAGLFAATLPISYGGLGFGMPGQSAEMARLFYQLGHASLPVARLYEAHVNALHLIFQYGSPAQQQRTAEDTLAGEVFALWVTDPPKGEALRLEDDHLQGAKAFCSGAGRATRALLTAETPEGIRMLVVPTNAARHIPSGLALSGMRAAITGEMAFSGIPAGPETWLGAPGDYLKEPVFSGGAWRGSAAALGGLGALLGLVRDELRGRGRDAAPQQRARFGQIAMAHEAARLWVAQAGEKACGLREPSADIVAYVNLARIAVEQLCMDALQATQRALGLSAFMAGAEAERIGRDLAAYLRQPAIDEVLDIAAAHYFATPLPGEFT
ncbi:MAG: acyl-CoA/acyl-ACP dehydrogenase [Rhodospirillales bacterium]|nr:acyl-CoA/acyl-ACP dehydrogenase [Rhodospirillales bacterium]